MDNALVRVGRALRLALLIALALLFLIPFYLLVLRHQLLVLQRQVGKPAFTDTDRVVLAGLAGSWWLIGAASRRQ